MVSESDTGRNLKRLIFVIIFCMFVYVTQVWFMGSNFLKPRINGYDQERGNVAAGLPSTVPHVNEAVPNSIAKNRSSFSRIVGNFDWDLFIVQLKQNNQSGVDSSKAAVIQILQEFLVMEPRLKIRTECRPPPLPNVTHENCSSGVYGNAFTGKMNTNPPKVGILIQFGFHVDELEMYLNEVYDVVDRFFIAESTQTHHRNLRKGLIWDTVKYQKRFSRFADKVVHFVVDDADSSSTRDQNNSFVGLDTQINWRHEITQEKLRWLKFVQWNEQTNYFVDTDLLGFGDADEIPARRSIHLLKHCSLKSSIVDIGIWFPVANFKMAYQTNFPVPDHPYTLGDPTFYTLQATNITGFASPHDGKLAEKEYPTRLRGNAGWYILGGVHLTGSPYLPFNLLKIFSCTECTLDTKDFARIERIASKIRSDELMDLQIEFGNKSSYADRLRPIADIGEEMKEIAILPWFYVCNKERYPVFESKYDNRLD